MSSKPAGLMCARSRITPSRSHSRSSSHPKPVSPLGDDPVAAKTPPLPAALLRAWVRPIIRRPSFIEDAKQIKIGAERLGSLHRNQERNFSLLTRPFDLRIRPT